MCTLFFNALLIITQLAPSPTSASGAPFLSSWATSLAPFPCPSSSNPLQPLSLVSGLARLCFWRVGLGRGCRGGWGGWGSGGNDTSLEMKRVTKAYQRAGCAKRRIIIGCCANQTRLHFMQSSSASGQLSFPRLRRETGNRWERERGRIRVSILLLCSCVFACLVTW